MRRTALIALVGGLLALVPAGASASLAPQTRIVGGTPTTVADWPWITFLEFSPSAGRSWSCGGVVVAPRMVLTAAHCVIDGQRTVAAGAIRGVAGRTTLSSTAEGVEFRFDRVAVHPRYVRDDAFEGGPFDAALLRTTTDVPVPPAQLATVADDPYLAPGLPAMVAGWGVTAPGGQRSDVLMQVDVPIIASSQCAQQDGITVAEAQLMVCAGRPEGGADSCQGDSGGPLRVWAADRWIIAGLVSWGYECAARDRPALYSRVSTYVDWVNGLIAGDEATWRRAGDDQAPALRLRRTQGTAGKRTEFVYRVLDASPTTWERITIRRTPTGNVLRSVAVSAHDSSTGPTRVGWRVPKGFDGRYVWCVVSHDQVGNTSKSLCAPLRVRA